MKSCMMEREKGKEIWIWCDRERKSLYETVGWSIKPDYHVYFFFPAHGLLQ